MARDGPPQPPSFKKILIGFTSLALKNSTSSFLAASVISSIILSSNIFIFKIYYNYKILIPDILINAMH